MYFQLVVQRYKLHKKKKKSRHPPPPVVYNWAKFVRGLDPKPTCWPITQKSYTPRPSYRRKKQKKTRPGEDRKKGRPPPPPVPPAVAARRGPPLLRTPGAASCPRSSASSPRPSASAPHSCLVGRRSDSLRPSVAPLLTPTPVPLPAAFQLTPCCQGLMFQVCKSLIYSNFKI